MSNQIPGDDEPADPGTTVKTTTEEITCWSVSLLFNPMPNALLNSGKIHLSVFKQRENGGGGWREEGEREGAGRMAERQLPLITINSSLF